MKLIADSLKTKTGKFLARLSKNGENSNKITNETRDITSDITVIQRIIIN